MTEYPQPDYPDNLGLSVVPEDEEEQGEEGDSTDEMSEADTADRPNSSAEEDTLDKAVSSSIIPDQPPKATGGKRAQRTNRAEVRETPIVKSNQNVCGKRGVPFKPTANDQSEDADEDEAEEEGDDAVQVALQVAEKALKLVLAGVKAFFRLVLGVLSLVKRTLGPLIGAGLFAAVAYLLGTYVMSPVTQADVPHFEARLKYLLRCQVWPTLPVFLAALAGFLRKNDVHKTFARDVFEQALLSLFNLLLLATHIDHEWILWVSACAVTATIFSLLHWFCLVYSRRPGSIFALPGSLLNFTVMAYNIYVIFGQDLGYVPKTTEQDLSPMQPGSQGRPSYWDHVTMCHLMEQMFCRVD